VYWTQPKDSELTPSVFGLDIASGRVREVARLSNGFYARELVRLDAGVAVYLMPANVPVNGSYQGPRDAARIALVDTATGRVREVPLPIRAGSYPDITAPIDEPFRSVEPGLAWDLPRNKLYVADADSDRVYVVDLRTGQVAGPFDPKPKRSVLDVIWSLFGSVASAKMVSTSRQHAAIAPDGTRLYVTGLRSDFAKAQDGKYHETVTPLDLRVIDTSDMSELARVDGATTRLWLSPDGANLVFGDNEYDRSVEGYAARSEFRLHVVNTTSNHERVTIPLGGAPTLSVFDARRIAFVGVQRFSGASLGHASLSLIDLARGRVIADRVMDRHFADVILLTGR
jgi:DNA-binding beta-propeller fold protein YncE